MSPRPATIFEPQYQQQHPQLDGPVDDNIVNINNLNHNFNTALNNLQNMILNNLNNNQNQEIIYQFLFVAKN